MIVNLFTTQLPWIYGSKIRLCGVLMGLFAWTSLICLRWGPLDPSNKRTTTGLERDILDLLWGDWYMYLYINRYVGLLCMIKIDNRSLNCYPVYTLQNHFQDQQSSVDNQWIASYRCFFHLSTLVSIVW